VRKPVLGMLLVSLAVAAPALTADVRALDQEYMARCGELAKHQLVPGLDWILGEDGWVLGWTEMVFLATPRFWGPDALKANPYGGPDAADPLVAIVDFHKRLAARGIDLIVVPVPTRPLIYPEAVLGAAKLAGFASTPYLYAPQREFYQLLAKQGVRIVDLTPLFLAARNDKHAPLFIPGDTHWTGLALSIAASEIATIARSRPWYGAIPKEQFRSEWKQTTHFGHIYDDLKVRTTLPVRTADSLWMRPVKQMTPGGPAVIEERQPGSPVVMIGDSNVDCWSHLDSSLSQQLAGELGFRVDRLSTSGGGATNTRVNLVRHARSEPGYLESKKLVIWVFTERTFVNAFEGWHKVELPGDPPSPRKSEPSPKPPAN
jgi:hypothetical protein